MIILAMGVGLVLAAIGDVLTQDAQLQYYKDADGNIDYERIERDNRFWDSLI